MKIVVAGATGWIGTPLCQHLADAGHEVVALTRRPEAVQRRLEGIATPVQWDGVTAGDWAQHLEGAGAVVNLSGEGIADRRWTDERKRILRSSRVEPTTALVDAIGAATAKPDVLVNSSAIGWYGPHGDEPLDETAPAGDDFLADVCRDWEAAARRAEPHCRVVRLRTGVVLGPDGGALAKMLTPFKLFVGGPIGSGKQQFSWIHRADVIGLIRFAIGHRDLVGPVNATAPEPLTMREFCAVLGSVLGRPSWAPVPAPVLKVALGEMADMLLTGQRVLPRAAQAAGYEFLFPTADAALRDILRR